METYFRKDGESGPASHIVILETGNWTSEDWDKFESVEDKDRQAMAISLDMKYKYDL